MRHGEYERRRRALEAQFREDIELLRAGYRAKLRALEMLWLTSPDEALPSARTPLQLSETVPPANETLRETLLASETVGEELPASETLLPEPPPLPPARPRGQAMEDVLAAFPELPEVFDQRDVVHALGYAPHRATLHRILTQLRRDQRIVMERAAEGSIPTRYRKLAGEGEGG